jgi:nitroreductase
LNVIQHTLNSVHKQGIQSSGDGDERETWQMKSLLLVAAAVGLGAIMAGLVMPDVARYLRIRRM